MGWDDDDDDEEGGGQESRRPCEFCASDKTDRSRRNARRQGKGRGGVLVRCQRRKDRNTNYATGREGAGLSSVECLRVTRRAKARVLIESSRETDSSAAAGAEEAAEARGFGARVEERNSGLLGDFRWIWTWARCCPALDDARSMRDRSAGPTTHSTGLA